jgi:hypothetical protein
MSQDRAFIPAADAHTETGGIVRIPGIPDPSLTAFRSLLQTLLDRDKYMGDTASSALSAALSTLYSNITGDGTWAKITADGGLAVTCTNRTSGTLTAGTVVEPYRGWDVTDPGAQLSNMTNVTGASGANTDAGVLYLIVTLPAGAAIVSAYSDADRQTKVAEGALADNLGGTVSLAEVGDSGLSFDIDIVSGAVQDLTGPYATRGSLSGVVKAVVSSIVPCGVIYEDVGSGESGWMTVAGKTMVQFTEDNPFGGYLITSATTAGKVDVLYDLDPTKVQRGVGYCPGRGHLGVGIYGACNLMLGRTWGV